MNISNKADRFLDLGTYFLSSKCMYSLMLLHSVCCQIAFVTVPFML